MKKLIAMILRFIHKLFPAPGGQLEDEVEGED